AAALELAERLLAAQPDDAAAQNLVGYSLVLAGRDFRRARALILSARLHAPGDAGVLDSLAWLERAEGDLAAAAATEERALRITPLDADVVVHAATIAVEHGDRANAAELLAMVPVTAAPELQQQAAALRARLAAAGGAPVGVSGTGTATGATGTTGTTGLAGGALPGPSCYARVRMRTPSLIRLVAGTALAFAACSKTPSKSQCDQLLTHLIDIEAGDSGAGKVPDEMKAEVDKQKKAIREYAIGQKFMDTCTHKTPRKVVECGIAAKTSDDVAKCDSK
ncbi:MAG TPA: hypothetical protein VHE35_03205, partial [Kofleriaceae bacterium]|nr:hypothetical protein [Kofleriaceae bacterium]